MATHWHPPLAPRGEELYNAYERYVLVEGARLSGKSIGCEHKILRHCLENDGAIVGIVAHSKATGGLGAWGDFIGKGGIIDQWRANRPGIGYAVKPSYKQDSKMPFFRLRTPPIKSAPRGGEVEFNLVSIFNEKDVEEKLKSTRFSMIYLTEASHFESKSVFTALSLQLRSFMVKNERCQMLIDTNPPEEAKKHWLYDVFFEHPTSEMKRIHFGIDDNPFITESQKESLRLQYAHDKNLLDRYYHGLWVEASTGGVFSDVFNPSMHVIGELPAGANLFDYDERDKWNILRPYQDTNRIDEGIDIGDVNLAYAMASSRYNPIKKLVCFDFIDELVYLDQRYGLSDVVSEIEDRRDYWSKWMLEQNEIPNIRWETSSDSSSMRHRIIANTTESAEIYRLSGRTIALKGVRKGAGSVSRRRDLLKRLLYENRIYVSPICKNIISMLKYIKSGQGVPIDISSPHKHIFDAVTYLLGYAVPEANGRAERGQKTKMRTFSME
jgi:PBSX family phage terminase large subunit